MIGENETLKALVTQGSSKKAPQNDPMQCAKIHNRSEDHRGICSTE